MDTAFWRIAISIPYHVLPTIQNYIAQDILTTNFIPHKHSFLFRSWFIWLWFSVLISVYGHGFEMEFDTSVSARDIHFILSFKPLYVKSPPHLITSHHVYNCAIVFGHIPAGHSYEKINLSPFLTQVCNARLFLR